MSKAKTPKPIRRWHFEPRLEAFEDRLLRATFVVTNTNDAGPGSLRQAILARNVVSDNHSIGILVLGGNNRVLGNFIGTDATGTRALGSRFTGVEVGGYRNIVGGTEPGAPNIISGNGEGVDFTGSDNVVEGNYIGTDLTGTQPLSNSTGVVVRGEHNRLGGTTDGARNLISANEFSGIDLSGTANQVLGNYVGTDITGAVALGNGANGVIVHGANNVVGGTSAGSRNIISANHDAGVYIPAYYTGNNVQGNYIGTDFSGTVPLGNGIGIRISGWSNTVGSAAAGAGNVISGNLGYGIKFDFGVNNTVLGNYIGADATGAMALANGSDGVFLSGSGIPLGEPRPGLATSSQETQGEAFTSRTTPGPTWLRATTLAQTPRGPPNWATASVWKSMARIT